MPEPIKSPFVDVEQFEIPVPNLPQHEIDLVTGIMGVIAKRTLADGEKETLVAALNHMFALGLKAGVESCKEIVIEVAKTHGFKQPL